VFPVLDDDLARSFSLCPVQQVGQNAGKKLRHLPHPLPEVEGSGGHEQVDGITEHSFQEIPGHSVIMFDMPNHRLNCGLARLRKRILALRRWQGESLFFGRLGVRISVSPTRV